MTVVVTHTTPADSSFSSTGAAAWNADHALSGVGTMAEQDANAVAITGGTINGATVGATTPAAGTFTTLTATGQTNLGTASANYMRVVGASAGFQPIISVQGSDTNVGPVFTSRGTGSIDFYTQNVGARQFSVANTSSAVNYVQVTGASTGNAVQLSAQGSNTNIPLVLQPKGTGALQAQQTDSTATGGNARGANAVDWQMSRTGATQVANGLAAVIAGGVQNTSSNNYSVVCGGTGNTASGPAAVVTGGQNSTASSTYSVAAGGGNVASGYASVAAGGYGNTAAGTFNFVGGGYINSANALAAVTTQSGTMNGTTAVTLSGSNANIKVGQSVVGTSIASFTYVAAISGTSLTLSQAASGSSTSTLSFFTPHGVVVGGGNNQATGSYSFIGGGGDAGTAANRNVASGDWSTVAGGRGNTASAIGAFVGGGGIQTGFSGGNTASGEASTISGGFGNTASNIGATVVGGYQNTASGSYSTILGRYGATRGISGFISFSASNAPINNTQGMVQAGMLVLSRQTTDATPTILCSEVSSPSTTNQVILPNNSAYYFRGTVVAGVTGGGNTKGWTIEGVIKRGANAASTTVVGVTVMSPFADVGAATWTIAAAADTTNGGLAITFTGQAGTTIRAVARLETTEMTF